MTKDQLGYTIGGLKFGSWSAATHYAQRHCSDFSVFMVRNYKGEGRLAAGGI